MPARKCPWQDLFWAKVNKTETCWLWTAAVFTKGYGFCGGRHSRCFVETHELRAHRVSWVIHYGPIPCGLSVLHSCDIPQCIRPTHLFLGTNIDNMRDKCMKGRQRYAGGCENGMSKLQPKDILEIRSLYAQGVIQVELAARFNTGKMVINRIVHNRSYHAV